MKIIDICGIPHEIIECKDIFDSDASHFGQIDYKRCEIRINEDATPELKKQILAHEVIHGIFVHLGLNEYTGNEHLVQSLASAINQSFEPIIKEI